MVPLHLSGPPLDYLQYAHNSLGSPKLGPVLQVLLCQCWLEKKDHLSWPVGDTLPNVAKTTISLSVKVMWLSHGQLGVKPSPFLQSCFPVCWPPACAGVWGCSFAGLHFFLNFMRLLSALIQPVQIPLEGCTSLMSQPFPSVPCHLQIYWECTLPHHSDS